MGKIIYTYLNDYDLKNILNIFSEHDVKCSNADYDNIKAISKGLPTFCFGYNDKTCINFIPCFYTLNQLQCAAFSIENNDEILNLVFTNVKKHIKSSYIISKDKSFYIGPEFYKEWMENKYCLPSLIKYDSFFVAENNLKELFNNVIENGNIIRNNNIRLRNVNDIDLSADSFVIFNDESKMLTTVLRKSLIRYECGSECIFIFKRKKGIYELILDDRISDNSECSIVKLFVEIKENFSILY